jgi:CrcB protein
VRDALLVALGGALGSLARWLVSSLAARLWPTSPFPWGTLAVNLVGSAVIGAVLTLAFERGSLPVPARLFLVTGLLGGFTTFSAFAWETLQLARSGAPALAVAYVLASVLGGLALAAFAARLVLRLS